MRELEPSLKKENQNLKENERKERKKVKKEKKERKKIKTENNRDEK